MKLTWQKLVLKGVYIEWAKTPLISGREQSMFTLRLALAVG
ncbi:hypothetical protein VCHA57P526_30222 [Vibrio chagasii]|nr:hypothetical protein VCHA57P526_30222 [Vibrio chagasii]